MGVRDAGTNEREERAIRDGMETDSKSFVPFVGSQKATSQHRFVLLS